VLLVFKNITRIVLRVLPDEIGILIVISNFVPLTRNLVDVHIVSPEISSVLDNDGTAHSLAGTEMGTSWLGASVASVTSVVDWLC
jgi:hypothetical protein